MKATYSPNPVRSSIMHGPSNGGFSLTWAARNEAAERWCLLIVHPVSPSCDSDFYQMRTPNETFVWSIFWAIFRCSGVSSLSTWQANVNPSNWLKQYTPCKMQITCTIRYFQHLPLSVKNWHIEGRSHILSCKKVRGSLNIHINDLKWTYNLCFVFIGSETWQKRKREYVYIGNINSYLFKSNLVKQQMLKVLQSFSVKRGFDSRRKIDFLQILRVRTPVTCTR